VKTFVHWLLAQRQRLIIVAVVAAPLFAIVTAGLLALETARRGVAQALLSSVAVTIGVSLLALVSRGDVIAFALIGLVSCLTGVLVGGLVRWAGNLVLAFQGVLLVCFALVIAFELFGPDPQALMAPSMQELSVVLGSAGYPETEIAAITAQVNAILPSLPALMVFSTLVTALMLGYWLWSFAGEESRFGEEFRALKLGRWLGAAAVLLLVLGLVFDAALVQNLVLLALSAAVFQGLALLHAFAHARRWSAGLMVLWYVVLLLVPIVLLPFGILGLIDNWLNLRARIREA
jgi:uncharacterized protein YybS (DUF2232 family)